MMNVKVAEGTNLTWQEGNALGELKKRMVIEEISRNGPLGDSRVIVDGYVSGTYDSVTKITGRIPKRVVLEVESVARSAEYCSASVSAVWHSYRCRSPIKYHEPDAQVYYDGKIEILTPWNQGFCGTHAPSKISERRAKKYKEERLSTALVEEARTAKANERSKNASLVREALKNNPEALEAFNQILGKF